MRILIGLIILICLCLHSCATLMQKPINYTVIRIDTNDQFYYTKKRDSLSNVACLEEFPALNTLLNTEMEKQQNSDVISNITYDRRATKRIASDFVKIIDNNGKFKYLMCMKSTGEVAIVKPLEHSGYLSPKKAERLATVLFEMKFNEGKQCLECMFYTINLDSFNGFHSK